MSSLPEPWLSPEEYLAIEREAETKSEYFDGHMYAMSGASEPHNVITVNLSGELRQQLRGRLCRAYSNDMRVKVSETGLYIYPDVVVVCGERRFDDAHRDTLLNPALLIEVLSPSTELYDRVKKFAQYRQLESLTDYLLVAQDRCAVDHYSKQGDQE
jgi:Uma2 family endonuclease